MKIYKIKFLIILLSLILIVFTGCTKEEMTKKPVIYLYPTSEQSVSVKLDYKGELTCT